jgi:hypothetical protein
MATNPRSNYPLWSHRSTHRGGWAAVWQRAPGEETGAGAIVLEFVVPSLAVLTSDAAPVVQPGPGFALAPLLSAASTIEVRAKSTTKFERHPSRQMK